MTARGELTVLILGCVSAFLGIASWFMPSTGTSVALAVPAVVIGAGVLWATRKRGTR